MGPNESGTPEAAATLEPRGVPVFDGYSGSAISWEEMVDAAASADVVVIGEMHGHEQGLATAAALWEDILARDALQPALSLEFFGRDKQALLDDYLLDVLDEEAFKKAASRVAGNYPPGHRAMVEAAKKAGVRVYGANSPRRYSTKARKDGFESLDGLRGSQKALFEKPGGLPEGAYRDRFFEQFRGMLASHGGEDLTEEEMEDRIEGYFRAQSVWDATMAGTISRAMLEGNRPVVQVVGQFHSDHHGGLIDQIWKHRPGARVVTLSMVNETDFAGEDTGRADFVVVVGSGGG